ncbi:MAG TPA: tRNA (adenosine(37)-N6)-dimethylallyltransferase MiaA [Candidatus Udaeobacter sp.]|jgi:tRNA dimethylallyltransferase|nr:tRNA (adenosine(37)-N6)-dimethylallyltransferase MiaA [Candidatus Udaeobacter sp.]
MRRAFFIVGPTATGKSEPAADVARDIGAEIVSADAFQIYRGLDRLSAKPDDSTLAKAPHHLIGTMALSEEMNAEKYRRAASHGIEEINSRGKLAIVVGGSGLYIRALTHGLASLPDADPKLREQLNAMNIDQLRVRLAELDPETARKIDVNNRRRLTRAVEICLLTGKPTSQVVAGVGDSGRPGSPIPATGIFVYRDREELYARINERVEAMFERGVIEEVRAAGAMSATASQMIGLREIRELLDGRISHLQCIAAIQQATRRYAKRQLTWFRRQTSFLPLNLSLLTHNEARILLRMRSELRRGSEVSHQG